MIIFYSILRKYKGHLLQNILGLFLIHNVENFRLIIFDITELVRKIVFLEIEK